MVNSKKPSTHAKYFYGKNWTKEQDLVFVNMLAWQADLGHRQTNPNRPSRVSLDYACGAVDVFAETSHPRQFYLDRLNVLCRRFYTFRRLLDEPGFTWNEVTNRVLAPKESWKKLIREDPFAKAYRHRGEPMWGYLMTIFEPSDESGYESDGESLGDRTADAVWRTMVTLVYLGPVESHPEVVAMSQAMTKEMSDIARLYPIRQGV
ncbi:hypothetical protein Sango_1144200 [Sesamum angolense]|uniref:Myb/SANT-like domain-containing protein n=1 Tax=Sesamum angolense TaxID=2727404 RepID=A0AAE1WVV6_9LAMI|nr:hypothetical protein Sango_1144200 [Sesamum angolense]